MIDGERGGLGRPRSQRAQRHLTPARRGDVDLVEELRILPEFGRGLHHHVILIQVRVHGRDLPLSEGIVYRVVDQLRLDAESSGRGSVVNDHGLQAFILLIAVHVRDDANRS